MIIQSTGETDYCVQDKLYTSSDENLRPEFQVPVHSGNNFHFHYHDLILNSDDIPQEFLFHSEFRGKLFIPH